MTEPNGFHPSVCGQYREKVDQLERDMDTMQKKLDRMQVWGFTLLSSIIVGIIVLIVQNASQGS